MANINVKFNKKDYLLSCDDGQEENLLELANYLDSQYNELQKKLGNIGENKLLLITAIKMVDEYFDILKKTKNSQNNFQELSKKFKELKSLAINYKGEKELEIQKLRDKINKFQVMIDESKNSYEKILDKTTESIEKFIENAESEKNVS